MHKKIAVEKNLNNVKDLFRQKGYQVDLFDDTQLHRIEDVGDYDAIIISGENSNFLGIEDTSTKVPVIDARGTTAEEIFNSVSRMK